jgi:3-phenylpropionate/trans-cinnamate dioxygenase ferredoxin reductase subunit
MTAMPTTLIVGAGLAGAKAAEAIRADGVDGSIVLIGTERDRPYERPPLSKGFLLGKDAKDTVYVHDEQWYGEHGVELRSGVTVTGLHRRERQVELAGGERLGYDQLLLATGSAPRRLAVPGADLDGVHYLRSLPDSVALRETISRGGAVVVVGGGWIGLEVAAAARHYDADVTLVEPQPAPLHGVLGREVGDLFAALHRDHGVDVRTGGGVTALEGGANGRVTGVRTSGGDLVPADAVVVGIGVAPNTRLAEAAGLEVDNGIVVDERLRTSDEAIWAAGDVANAWNPLLEQRLRVEHWANAKNQGSAVGAVMAAQARGESGEPYAKLPYFFTDQYDLSMEYHGHVGPAGYDRVVVRGEPPSGAWFAFWLRDGRVLAGMNVNDWDAADPIKALVRSRATVDPAALADPAVPLPELVPPPAE